MRHPRPRSPNGHQHHPHLRDNGGPALGALGRSSAPLTPRSWTSGLHNHHGIISGVLSHPVCEFSTAASTTALRRLLPHILPGVQAMAGPAATRLPTRVPLTVSHSGSGPPPGPQALLGQVFPRPGMTDSPVPLTGSWAHFLPQGQAPLALELLPPLLSLRASRIRSPHRARYKNSSPTGGFGESWLTSRRSRSLLKEAVVSVHDSNTRQPHPVPRHTHPLPVSWPAPGGPEHVLQKTLRQRPAQAREPAHATNNVSRQVSKF